MSVHETAVHFTYYPASEQTPDNSHILKLTSKRRKYFTAEPRASADQIEIVCKTCDFWAVSHQLSLNSLSSKERSCQYHGALTIKLAWNVDAFWQSMLNQVIFVHLWFFTFFIWYLIMDSNLRLRGQASVRLNAQLVHFVVVVNVVSHTTLQLTLYLKS